VLSIYKIFVVCSFFISFYICYELSMLFQTISSQSDYYVEAGAPHLGTPRNPPNIFWLVWKVPVPGVDSLLSLEARILLMVRASGDS